MKKRTKPKPTRQKHDPGRLPQHVVGDVEEAHRLLGRKRWVEARDLFEEVDRETNGHPVAIAGLLCAADGLRDHVGSMVACRRLLRRYPEDERMLEVLASTYLLNEFPALARRAHEDLLRRVPDEPSAGTWREILRQLDEELPLILASAGLQGTGSLALAETHEEMQVALAEHDFDRARQLGEDLLRQKPDFVPALNNLTLVHQYAGRPALAIEAAERALAIQPANLHAHANLVRCLCLAGRFDDAHAAAARLVGLPARSAADWTKLAETLAFLGDDEGILALVAGAEAARQASDPMLLHLAAVALLRLERESEARKLWQRALRLQPGFDLARKNLDDLRAPAGKREGPWPFTLGSWLPSSTVESLYREMKNLPEDDEGAVAAAVRRFLQRHPEIPPLIPAFLDRGGPEGRGLALILAKFSDRPELAAALCDFALGPRGSDAARMQAGSDAADAGQLAPGPVRMWMGGEQVDTVLFKWDLHDEPMRRYPHSPQVARWYEEAVRALHARDPRLAESLLRMALEAEPDRPDLLNNMAAVLSQTGRQEKATALMERIYQIDPDYLFARTNLARIAAQRGDVARAHELLDPLLECRRMHFNEFSSFVSARIDLHVAEKDIEAADAWLHMWASAVPDDPALKRYLRDFKLLGRTRRPLTGGDVRRRSSRPARKDR